MAIRRYPIHPPQLVGRITRPARTEDPQQLSAAIQRLVGEFDGAMNELQRFLRYLTDASASAQAGAGIEGVAGGAVDHGLLAGLSPDDDHPQYLKEKAYGGLAVEIPLHDHSASAEAGTVDHGDLDGLADNDHTQYVNAVSDTPTLDLSLVGQSISGAVLPGGIDHGALGGLVPDNDHPQYEPVESGFTSDSDATTLSFVDLTRTFTITPTGASFEVWSGGNRFVKAGPESLVISDVEGVHSIYYDAAGALQELVNGSVETLDYLATVATVYWNADAPRHNSLIGQRHGRIMDAKTRRYLKVSEGTVLESGFALSLGTSPPPGTGNNAADAQAGIADGAFWRADLYVEVQDGLPQNLFPSPGNFPIYYLSGVGALWRMIDATDYVVAAAPAGRGYYNDINAGGAGVWGLTEIAHGNYGLMHVFVVNDVEHPVVLVMGQQTEATISAIQAAALTELPGLVSGSFGEMFDAFLPIATLIFETKNTFGNAVKSRIVQTAAGGDYVDWRTVPVSSTGISVWAHNSLTGLQGGSVSERYHLSLSEAVIATDPVIALTGVLFAPSGLASPPDPVIAWRAPFACTVESVKGYRVGGASADINARRNGTDEHLSSDLTLAAADTWVDGGTVQNVDYVAGDKLEIMVPSVTGSPTQIAVQVGLRRA